MMQITRILILRILGSLGLLLAILSLFVGYGFTKVFAYAPQCEFSISQNVATIGNTISLQVTLYNHTTLTQDNVNIIYANTHVNRYDGSYSDWTTTEETTGIRYTALTSPLKPNSISTFSSTVNFDTIGEVQIQVKMSGISCLDLAVPDKDNIPLTVYANSMSNQTTSITKRDVDLISLAITAYLSYKLVMLFVFRGTE